MTEEPKQFIIADDPPEWEPVYVKGKKSLALIVMKNGRGRILDSIGSSMEAYIEDHSEAIESDDLMIDAPEGVSMWEGVYRVFQCPEGDYDSELDGDFRPVTDDEWEHWVHGDHPWDPREWIVNWDDPMRVGSLGHLLEREGIA